MQWRRARTQYHQRICNRHLHARWVKHAHRALAVDSPVLAEPAALPARGLLLQSSPLLPALWALGGAQATTCPAAKLVRALWHRHEPQEPLRYTRNRSLPGCHLANDPALQGHLFGLAVAGATDTECVVALKTLGVGPLARRTKVSLTRFARIAGFVRDGLGGGKLLPPSLCTSSVMLAFVWASAERKEDLLRFFEAAATHLPSGAILGNEYAPKDDAWRRAWLAQAFASGDADDDTPAVIAAASSLARDARPAAEARELLAFAITARGSGRPEIEQMRHTYNGQKSVPDCVEAVVRDSISLALWDSDNSRFDPSRLPSTADPGLTSFFKSRLAYSSGREAGSEFFDLCSDRPRTAGNLLYMSGGGSRGEYELHPSVENFVAAMSSLVGAAATAPDDAPKLLPMWPGSQVGWTVHNAGTDRPALELKLLPPPSSASYSPGARRKRTEALRLIFTNSVHCYALRRVDGDGPQWLAGVHRAWLERWRLHGASNASDGLGREAIAAACVLGPTMLHASAHRVANGGGHQEDDNDVSSALVAVLAATPHGYEERTAGLSVLLSARQEAWWALPLLLQPPPATGQWDSLTLGSCAELIAPKIVSDGARQPAAVAPALFAAAGTSPALQAVVALRADEHEMLTAALARCSDAEAALVLRIALGFSGFGVAQRWRALVAVSATWWRQRRALTNASLGASSTDPVFH